MLVQRGQPHAHVIGGGVARVELRISGQQFSGKGRVTLERRPRAEVQVVQQQDSLLARHYVDGGVSYLSPDPRQRPLLLQLALPYHHSLLIAAEVEHDPRAFLDAHQALRNEVTRVNRIETEPSNQRED